MAYEWLPEHIDEFGKLFRSILPDGYLGIEHSIGHIPCGEGDADWVDGGCMRNYDVLLSEFDGTPSGLVHDDAVWQVAGRTLGPVSKGGTYIRPPDQPANDDPSPPWYLRQGTPRGPYFVIAYEYDTYHWSRGQVSVAQIEQDRAYLKSLGYPVVC